MNHQTPTNYHPTQTQFLSCTNNSIGKTTKTECKEWNQILKKLRTAKIRTNLNKFLGLCNRNLLLEKQLHIATSTEMAFDLRSTTVHSTLLTLNHYQTEAAHHQTARSRSRWNHHSLSSYLLCVAVTPLRPRVMRSLEGPTTFYSINVDHTSH